MNKFIKKLLKMFEKRKPTKKEREYFASVERLNRWIAWSDYQQYENN